MPAQVSSTLRDTLAAICFFSFRFSRPSVMVEEGYGIIVLERADYVLTGCRSKLQAVVTPGKGLKERGRERIGLLMDDDCRLLSGGGDAGH